MAKKVSGRRRQYKGYKVSEVEDGKVVMHISGTNSEGSPSTGRWTKSLESFRSEVGKKPQVGMTL